MKTPIYRLYKPCEHCNGTGTQFDDIATGKDMRERREAKNVSQRSLAKQLGWSAPYLSDLEKGRRRWTEEKITRYLEKL